MKQIGVGCIRRIDGQATPTYHVTPVFCEADWRTSHAHLSRDPGFWWGGLTDKPSPSLFWGLTNKMAAWQTRWRLLTVHTVVCFKMEAMLIKTSIKWSFKQTARAIAWSWRRPLPPPPSPSPGAREGKAEYWYWPMRKQARHMSMHYIWQLPENWISINVNLWLKASLKFNPGVHTNHRWVKFHPAFEAWNHWDA